MLSHTSNGAELMQSKKSQMAELRRSLTDGIELKSSGRRMTLHDKEAPDVQALLAMGSDDEEEGRAPPPGPPPGGRRRSGVDAPPPPGEAAAFWKQKENGEGQGRIDLYVFLCISSSESFLSTIALTPLLLLYHHRHICHC